MMAEEAPSNAAPLEEAQANTGGLDGAKDQPQNPAPQPESATNPKSNHPNPSSETANSTAATLTSPISTQPPLTSDSTSGPVPLDSTLRTTPIHPSVTSVKVPAAAVAGSTEPNTNPITLKPFTEAELAKYGFEKLRAQITTRSAGAEAGGKATDSGAGAGSGGKANEEEIKKLREETAALLKQKLDEREAKIREIEREMEEKEKIREVERKVFRKKLGANAPASASTPGPGAGPATVTSATTTAGTVDS